MVANAAIVPRINATGVTTSATAREFLSDSRTSGFWSASRYHSRVKPLNGRAITIESLNENSARINNGP